MSFNQRIRVRSRCGLTLVELLVVVTVMVLLLSASVPLLQAPLKSRRTREASRQINGMIARVKARAAEIGRPVGLSIRRSGTGDRSFYSYQLGIVESPPPYSGDLPSSNADVAINGNTWTATLSDSQTATVLVKAGDLIRFNYKEPNYVIINMTTQGNDVVVEFAASAWAVPSSPPPPPVNDLAFQIFPGPVTGGDFNGDGVPDNSVLSTSSFLDLPNGTVIDLTVSGMGTAWNQFTAADPSDNPANQPFDYYTPANPANDTTDVIIMFGTGGAVDRVYFSEYINSALQLSAHPATGTIYLMVGKLEQVNPNDVFLRSEDLTANLVDPESLWVAISHKTGKVTTAENNSLDVYLPAPGQPIPIAQAPGFLATAREFVTTAQSMGGR